MSDTFKERLKRARLAAGLTQADLARQVNVTPQAIQHLESGSSRSSRSIHRLAAALGVQTAWLESGEGEITVDPAKSSINLLKASAKARLDLGEQAAKEDAESISDETVDMAFYPPEELTYHTQLIPVYVGLPLSMLINRNRRFELIAAHIFSDITEKGKTPEVRERLALMGFNVCSAALPDDYISRPAYLAGQVDAYGLFAPVAFSLRPKLVGTELLHVSPHVPPRRGDMVIVWHTTNAFLIGEFIWEDPDQVTIKLYLDDWISVTGTRFTKTGVKAVHTVRGLEFTEPRSSKMTFGNRVRLESDQSGVTGAVGLGGVDPLTWEGPDAES